MKKALSYFSLAAVLLLHHTGAIAHTNEIITVAQHLEEKFNAQLGLAVLDLESGQRWEYQADQRFPINSTFKTLACAALLQQVDDGTEKLTRELTFPESELVTYSPITTEYAGRRAIALGELCMATMSMSDNTAANLILKVLGGPEGLTAFTRRIGDKMTRIDRWETQLNTAIPGDLRDTTTPNAMVDNLHRLLFSDLLSRSSRDQLLRWLKSNRVADDLFRAVIPQGWSIADRTGAGGYGSRSITAVLFPPNRKPIIAAVYLTRTERSFAERNKAIAEIGATIIHVINSNTD